MRQSELYILDSNSNDSVKFFLTKWWFPNTSYNVAPTLVQKTTTRYLNSFEIDQFYIDPSKLPIRVMVGYQLEINHNKYSSISYKSLPTTHAKLKKCSYFIKYNLDDHSHFGMIDYYIKLENIIYAVVYQVNVLEYDFKIDMSTFSDIFVEKSCIFYKGMISKKMLIINVNLIERKCIYTPSFSDKEIYFSDFISEIDHN
jgi:hypothetical protein